MTIDEAKRLLPLPARVHQLGLGAATLRGTRSRLMVTAGDSQIKGPSRTETRCSLCCGPYPLSATKTRAMAEGGTKKGHFYEPLKKEFRRGAFQYRQIAHEGNAAIYEQTWLGCAEPSPSYEVVRIRRREGFQIGNRLLNAAEICPNSRAWGVDGLTLTNRNKAWDKFFEISLEEPARIRREVK